MKTFAELSEQLKHIKEWGWDGSYNGHEIGHTVQIHEPGHANHGKVGKIIRQRATNFAVELPDQPGKVSWHNAAELKKRA